MSAATALARGRQMAEQLMVDTCTVTRVTGTLTSPTTGAVVETTTTVYTGACRIQQRTVTATPEEGVGQQYVRLLQLELQLPMSATGLAEGDRVTVTASQLDADLAGRTFRIRDLAHKSHATARRLGIEEET